MSFIFGGAPNIETSAPIISSFRVQTSAYGRVIPLVYGKARLAANVIDYDDFTAIAHTTTQSSGGGGKGGGGGGGSNTTYTYTAAALLSLCAGPIGGVPTVWNDKSVATLAGLGLTLFPGSATQDAFGYMSTHHPDKALNYRHLAYVASGALDLGSSANLPAYGFEIAGLLPYGDTGQAVLAFTADVGGDRLQAAAHGYAAGRIVRVANSGGALPGGLAADTDYYVVAPTADDFQVSLQPAGAVVGLADAGSGAHTVRRWIADAEPTAVIGDVLDRAGFPAARFGDWSQLAACCVANGLFISPAWQEQAPTRERIDTLAQIANAGPVFSDGVLKLVPYSDAEATGNGVTYTPATTAAYDLTDDDFLPNGDDEPVRVRRKDSADFFNKVEVQYYDRANQYNQAVQPALDQANIDLHGLRADNAVRYDEIADGEVATLVAHTRLQRAIYVPNIYEFRLGPQYGRLEPMDIVTLTESTGSDPLDGVPVIILEISESDDFDLTVTAEDYPAGVGAPQGYGATASLGYAINANTDPGDALAPVVIEPPVERTRTGLELWIGVTGAPGQQWGGAHVWVSLDGDTYKQAGTATGPARIGHLTADLAAGSSGPLALQLVGLGGTLASGTAADAEALATLLYVAGDTPEYLTYQDVTLTGDNAYSLAGLTRGRYGSADATHLSGAAVARVDDALVKGEPLDLDWIGRTVYIKLQSFNVFGGGTQDLADLTAHAYTITGAMAALPPPDVSGFAATTADDRIVLGWDSQAVPDFHQFEIRSDENWGQQDAGHVGTVDATTLKLLPLPAGSYTWRIRAIDRLGNYSAASALASLTVVAPAAPGLSAEFVGPDLRLTLIPGAADYAVLDYELRHGASFAAGTPAGRFAGTTHRFRADFSGARTFWVAALDAAGNVGAAASVEVVVTPPLPPVILTQVVDNNVLFYWPDCTQTLPIEGYELRRGATWAAATIIGTKQGLFTTVFETSAGTPTFWLAGIDSAGNVGTPGSVAVTVTAPPDYVLFADYDSTFSGAGVTLTDAQFALGVVVLPVNTTETWAQHFTDNAWGDPQDQIDAGYPLYIEPVPVSASYEEIIDYGTMLAGSRITVTPTGEVVAGAPVLATTISVKAALGDPWTDYAGVSEIYAAGFRYIKWTLDVTGSGGNDLYRLTALNIKLDAKLKNDAGSISAVSTDTGGTDVTFNVAFIDVETISVTPQSIGASIPLACIYDFTDAPNPTGFKVLVFRTDTGARVSTTVSWTAKGY